jgi:hypothetical protein
MFYKPINWILDFLDDLYMFFFSCDWKEAFKKEKKWDKEEEHGNRFMGA